MPHTAQQRARHRRYITHNCEVLDLKMKASDGKSARHVALAASHTLAKRIANALNIYIPKRSRERSCEDSEDC